jgi:hypothetical protein
MKSGVQDAVTELRSGLPDSQLRVLDDPDGGAFVVVDAVQIGSNFVPSSSWVGFQITFAYPDSDVYPHFSMPGCDTSGKLRRLISMRRGTCRSR